MAYYLEQGLLNLRRPYLRKCFNPHYRDTELFLASSLFEEVEYVKTAHSQFWFETEDLDFLLGYELAEIETEDLGYLFATEDNNFILGYAPPPIESEP